MKQTKQKLNLKQKLILDSEDTIKTITKRKNTHLNSTQSLLRNILGNP